MTTPPPITDESAVAEVAALTVRVAELERQLGDVQAEAEHYLDELQVYAGKSCGGHCQSAPCSMCDGTGWIDGTFKVLQEDHADATERADKAESELAAARAPVGESEIVKSIAWLIEQAGTTCPEDRAAADLIVRLARERDEARDKALEEAAKRMDRFAKQARSDQTRLAFQDAAESIRALKSKGGA